MYKQSELGRVLVIRVVIDFEELVKVALKRGHRKRGGQGKRYVSYWVLWPLCVFGYTSVVALEGACVKDCRG
jgi:hypothetical protein